jgi:hypothetical protein
MQQVTIVDAGKSREALVCQSLPAKGDELHELIEILMGRDHRSAELLRPVIPGTVPDQLGAEQLLYFIIEELPEGDRWDERGVYAVGNWVVDVLDRSMPEGWGAAMTQPMMFPLLKKETYQVVGHFEWLGARQAGEPTANGVIISPMDRTKTSKVGAMLSAAEGTEVLVPLSRAI